MARSHETKPEGLSRRAFLQGAGGLAAGGVVIAGATAGVEGPESVAPAPIARLAGEVDVELDVNGVARTVRVEPRTTLLSALRDRCDPPLTGTKIVCDRGTCGACTVLLDGKPVYSCMTLAANAAGRRIRTVEGLAPEGGLSPVQESFWEEDALMCGFCTPGFLMSITASLEEKPHAGEDEIRRACSGNLCRCGTYPHVFRAALSAGRKLKGGRK